MSNGDAYDLTREFHNLKRKAYLSALFSSAVGASSEMVSLDEAKSLLKPHSESFQGRRPIPVDRIVGSEGRYADFDGRFLPRRNSGAHRWVRVATAFRRDIPLPAIQVYELAGMYFVRDGNHRVSVARHVGRAFLDAEVTTLGTEIDVGEAASVEEIKAAIAAYERHQFLKEVDLLDIESGPRLTMTAPGAYDSLYVHISYHKSQLEVGGAKVSYGDATRSWYETIFLPLAKMITDSGVLEHSEERTAADFYVWLVDHWDEIPVGGPLTDRSNRLRRVFRRFAKSR